MTKVKKNQTVENGASSSVAQKLEVLLVVAHFDSATTLFTLNDRPLKDGKERVIFDSKRLSSEKDITQAAFDKIMLKSGKLVEPKFVDVFSHVDDEGGFVVHLYVADQKKAMDIHPTEETRRRLSKYQIKNSKSTTLLTKECAKRVCQFLQV